MASNQILNKQNDIDEDVKVALITGITGQVNKTKTKYGRYQFCLIRLSHAKRVHRVCVFSLTHRPSLF